jgi:hypothetical protein
MDLTRQIIIPVNSTADNHQIFYEKGASVNRMAASYLGAVGLNSLFLIAI